MSDDNAIAGLACVVFFASLAFILLVSFVAIWKQSHNYLQQARKSESLSFWAMQKSRDINHKIVRLKKSKLIASAQLRKKERNMFVNLARLYSQDMHAYLEKNKAKRSIKVAKAS